MVTDANLAGLSINNEIIPLVPEFKQSTWILD
jgi:hypothetical protein